ncbi:MAG: DUF6301 family protein [Actinomycetaceae bacterium]|nr:DUF6301 family protein [Actinomycetaceae bacterium]
MSRQPATELTQLTNFIDSLTTLTWPLYQSQPVPTTAQDRRRFIGWSPVPLPTDFVWSLLPVGKGQEVSEIEVQYALGKDLMDEDWEEFRAQIITHFNQVYGEPMAWEDEYIRFSNYWWEHPKGLRINLRFDDDPYWEIFISGPLTSAAGSGTTTGAEARLELMSVSDATLLVEKLVAASWPLDVPQLMRFTRALGWTPIAESNVYFYTNYGKAPLVGVALPTAAPANAQLHTRVPEAYVNYSNGLAISITFAISNQVREIYSEAGMRLLNQRVQEIIEQLKHRYGKGMTYPAATRPVNVWHLPGDLEVDARIRNDVAQITVRATSPLPVLARVEKTALTAGEAMAVLEKWMELPAPITAEYADYLAQNLGWERTRQPFTQNYYTELSHPGQPKVAVTAKDGVVEAITLNLGNFSDSSNPAFQKLSTELQTELTRRYGAATETEQGLAKLYIFENEATDHAVHLVVTRAAMFLTLHLRQETDTDIDGQIDPAEHLKGKPATTAQLMGFFFGVMLVIMIIISYFG